MRVIVTLLCLVLTVTACGTAEAPAAEPAAPAAEAGRTSYPLTLQY